MFLLHGDFLHLNMIAQVNHYKRRINKKTSLIIRLFCAKITLQNETTKYSDK